MKRPCDWDPERGKLAVIGAGCKNEATLLVGSRRCLQLCESCAALPDFKRLKKKPLGGALPEGEVIARHDWHVTRGECRATLKEYGYEGTEAQIQAFARAYLGTRASALHAAEEVSYGGLVGMSIRAMIEDGAIPVTREAREDLYTRSEAPPLGWVTQ